MTSIAYARNLHFMTFFCYHHSNNNFRKYAAPVIAMQRTKANCNRSYWVGHNNAPVWSASFPRPSSVALIEISENSVVNCGILIIDHLINNDSIRNTIRRGERYKITALNNV